MDTPGADVTGPADGDVEVSVLIPVRDAADLIAGQLAALAAQTFSRRWEIVVADNGSTDATVSVVRDWSQRLPQLRIVRCSEVPNANATRNCAAAAARGSLFAFCDADDVVHPNWLDALAVAAHDADLIGGRLDVDSLNDATTTRWRPMVTRPGTAPAFGYLPYAISANMAVTRTAFMAVGGFDADIKRGSEEVDFCWRVQQAGFRFAYSADAVVSYRLRGDLRSFVRQQFRYGRAEATLYMRHRPLMQRDSLSSLGRAAWFALTRWHHVVRGAALRGRYLGYVAYRLGRLVGGLLAPIPYW